MSRRVSRPNRRRRRRLGAGCAAVDPQCLMVKHGARGRIQYGALQHDGDRFSQEGKGHRGGLAKTLEIGGWRGLLERRHPQGFWPAPADILR